MSLYYTQEGTTYKVYDHNTGVIVETFDVCTTTHGYKVATMGHGGHLADGAQFLNAYFAHKAVLEAIEKLGAKRV